MSTSYSYIKYWKKKCKEIMIFSMGGKCQLCGYSNCNQALEFHHIEKDKKDFSLSRTARSWEKVYEELSKCILVCSNCHQEIHYNVSVIPENYFKFDKSIADSLRFKEIKETKNQRLGRILGRKQALELFKNKRKDIIQNSNVDFSKYGWATKLAKIIGIESAPLVRWMKENMSEFYENNCYKNKLQIKIF